ncbi:hypothetical protein OJ253_1423 [Cryptosporidium canis]|uniref:Uncharacterized protein n=1 Tax=Cryptosporidium canis TaxID=195482 RepID=A0A9D5DJB9_9CRYT|nr:hypothetical protein OJ253_1423 [Cryptosporidium canis]
MNTKTRCREAVNDCVCKMMENMNRIIEQSQISTLEGTAYDSFLSSFSMKIQISKIVSLRQDTGTGTYLLDNHELDRRRMQQVAAEMTLNELLNDPGHKFDQVQMFKDYLSRMSKIDDFQM